MASPWYATRELVMDALDTKVSAYRSSSIDRALESASRNVESLTHRIFYPLTATKSWPWPGTQDETSMIWLDGNELYSAGTVASGGVTIPASGYYLEPNAYGPPYDRIEINRGSSYAFAGGASGPQRSLSITGVFCGCDVYEATIGALNGAIASTTSSSVTLTVPVGVGRILRVDSERMIVTEKAWTASAQTGSLTLSVADQTLTVSDGTKFTVREYLLLDAEMVQVLAIVGNVLTVKRAVQGSVLAAHTTASIAWNRSFVVARGQLGTTAATHIDAAPVVRYDPPGLIEQLTIAYALDRGLQELSGYARTIGSGENERAASSRGIAELEKDVRAAHGRMARFRSV